MKEYLKTFYSDEFPGKFLVQLQLENLSNEESAKLHKLLADMIQKRVFKTEIGILNHFED